MMHLQYAVVLAAVLAGLGIYGMLARRNAVLVLIGLELVLAAGTLLLVAAGARPFAPSLGAAGALGATNVLDAAVPAAGAVPAGVLTLFVITIAAAEVVVALAVILLLFRRRGDIDLTKPGDA